MIRILLIILSLTGLSCSTDKPGGDTNDESEIEKIRQTMKAYRQAWIAGDSAAVLGMVSDQIIIYMPTESGKPKVGKAEVAEHWFPASDLSYPITGYEVVKEAIEFSDQLCMYSGVSSLTWHIKNGEIHSDTTTSVTEFLNILRKENKEWKLYRVIYNLKSNSYE